MLQARPFQSQTQTIPPRSVSIVRSDLLVGVILFFVMGMGGLFRFVSLNWDDFVRFHPDERFLTMNVAPKLGMGFLNFTTHRTDPISVEEQTLYCAERNPTTNGVGGYFDTRCSDWNPHNVGEGLYVYGTLPLFLTRVVAQSLNEFGAPGSVWTNYWTDSNGLQLVWRFLSATADMIVIFIVFLIGTRLHGKWVGLLAAALYAACVFPIQQAHFGTTDAMSNLFVTLAIYAAVRVQVDGKLSAYALFGLAYGMALSSRINVLPVVGLLIVAAGLRILPALLGRDAQEERNRIITYSIGGLVLAGFITIFTFRLLNPYAFMGPGFFGLRPNPAFLDDIATAQNLVSGKAESPPNYQWIGRINYLFPWQNIVLWGMGIALGLSGWFGWTWSGWRVLRGKPGSLRNLLLFGWILVYFGWLGGNWVASMRYFLVLYPVLCVLAAWALVELARPTFSKTPKIRPLGAALLIGVVGFTFLWAGMFTNIYRHTATFTQASYWTWENVPGDFAMRIDGASPDVPLLNVGIYNTNPITNPDLIPIENYLFETATRYQDGQSAGSTFKPTIDGTVSSIHAPHLGDLGDDAGAETVSITITHQETGEIVGTATLTVDLTRSAHPLGNAYDIPFDAPMQVQAYQNYTLNVIVSDGPVIGAGSVMALESAWEEGMPANVCTLPDGTTLADDPPAGMFTIYTCNGRSVWAGLLNGYLFNTHDEDDVTKLHRMTTILSQTDYIMVPTNRRYDTHSRNPSRWPLTNRFYEALFNGELGFDLVETFQETFELGPLRVSDQYLPTYDAPRWLNEFEPEEAFTVYDHPVVFIFKKRADYLQENAQNILYGVSLTRTDNAGYSYDDPTITNIQTLSSLQADVSPTGLMMTDDMRQTQYSGGTWSERFNSRSPINTQPVVTVLVWWLIIVVFGWAVWPLLFALLPGLADRGYGVAKYVGILLTGWSTWVVSSLRVPVWSQAGIFGALLILALISAFTAFRNREKLIVYLKKRWQLLIWIEVISFALFLFMLAVRLTNPDLWHSSFGGEKPMDFAYFNGVLRSTIFPPIDPWYAGGYLNYYYFGFVIVGTPTLLLGVIPSIAYNLILPTLFSLTGIAAFSVAFNVVSAWRGKADDDALEESGAQNTLLTEIPKEEKVKRRTLGNPWVAGIMAMVMAVLLGNLDTVRVFANGVAKMGGYEIPQGFDWYLREREERAYQVATGLTFEQIAQDATAQQEIGSRISEASVADSFGDHIGYEVFKITSLVEGLVGGAGKLLQGQPLYVSPDRWFWAPTRVIAEIPEVNDFSIAEMPYFTYLYGDMHAHMIAMPLILFVAVFVFNELIIAGRERRSKLAQCGALLVGAIAVGMSKAVNSWDWPTLTILSVLGLGYAWWLTWGKINRHSLLNMLVRIGGFVTLTVLVVKPYDAFFATAFTKIQLWGGGNTPIWAYLDIHGLFIFMIFSLLLWETARWMRSVKVAALRGKAPLLLALTFAIIIVWLAGLMIFFRGERAALIVLPLVAWIGLLFFRPGQSRSMQFVLVLAGLSLCITLGVEFVVLGGDNGRQNTVFKFYNQVWLFLSVVGGAAFSWLVASSIRWKPKLVIPWYAVATTLVLMAVLFPIMATRGKAVFRLAPNTPVSLDGMAYMQFASYGEETNRVTVNGVDQGIYETLSLPDDYTLIRWLQENIQGSPVIIEAQSYGSVYKYGGRIAINTGLPSVLGWDYHQTQQRSLSPMPQVVRQRGANVNAFYTTTDVNQAGAILRHYEVSYVIVGSLERARYSLSGGLDKLARMVDQGMLSIVYEEGLSTVYSVNQAALSSIPIVDLGTVINLQTGQ